MFILLDIAAVLYFILGKNTEGWLMLAAILFVGAISVFQESRSSKALKALKRYTEPNITVIRDGIKKNIEVQELVPGDIIVLEEGNKVPDDAIVLEENDFTVNESVITGESFPVEKQAIEGKEQLFQGTTVNSGKCIARVTGTGNQTVLGKLGKAVDAYISPKTLLQQQVSRFVRQMALFGFSAFTIIWLVNYLKIGEVIQSLLFGLTLAMATIPEEIPVALSSFMALGAYHMSKFGIISRQPQIIENLGVVTVICLDKTGTLTENRMAVKMIYDYDSDRLINIDDSGKMAENNVISYAMLASERDPFDMMSDQVGLKAN